MFDDIVEYTREIKTVIYVLKTLNELVEKGLMEGGMYEVSQKGLDIIEGFEPTNEELQECIRLMKEQDMIACKPTTSIGKAFLGE